MIAILWVISSIAVAYWAAKWGRRWWVWLLISIFCTPLVSSAALGAKRRAAAE